MTGRFADASLLLLAGGAGSRMGGRNKLFLKTGGLYLAELVLERTASLFSETLLLAAPGEAELAAEVLSALSAKFDFRVVEDRAAGRGPLEGLCRGLSEMRGEWGFLCGCDMPAIEPAAVAVMAANRTPGSQVVAAEVNGYIEPLHAFYHKSCLPLAEAGLLCGDKKIKCFYAEAALKKVSEEVLYAACQNFRRSFLNINRPDELARFEKTRAQSVSVIAPTVQTTPP